MSKSKIVFVVEGLVSLSMLVYFASLALVPGLYNLAPAVLLVLAVLGFQPAQIQLAMERKDWCFASVFVGYFICFGFLALLHGDNPSVIDRPSRFLAAAIILTLLLRVNLSSLAIFAGASLGGVGAGVYALSQWFGTEAGRISSFDNAIYFGNAALVLALGSFSGLVYELGSRFHSKFWLLLYAAGAAGGLVALMLSGTRGGWLAVPLIFVIFVWAYRHYLFRHRGVLAIAMICLAVITGAATTQDIVSSRIQTAVEQATNYFEEDSYTHTSVGARLEMWRAGWMMVKANPVAGVGLSDEKFDRALEQLVSGQVIDSSILTFRHLHNQFVDHAAKGGALAVLALLVALGAPIILFAPYLSSDTPSIRALSVFGVAFQASFLVFCLTQGMFSRNIGVMMYVIVPVLVWSMIRREEAPDSHTAKGGIGLLAP